MKKNLILAAALALTLSLCACGDGKGNDLFKTAAPENGALTLYICTDGESVRMLRMYDDASEREIFGKLAEVTAKPAGKWTAKDVTVPVYAIETGRNDDEPGDFEAAWSNGYLITPDGSAYKFDFDFAALETQYEWRDSEDELAMIRLPCSHALALCGEEWISSMLTPAAELSPPEGISMTLDSVEDGEITVTLRNDSGEVWTYGEFYHIEVLLDGGWYRLPAFTGYGVIAIAYRLSAGESRQESYWTEPFGELPPGTYRLVAMDMTAEFAVE